MTYVPPSLRNRTQLKPSRAQTPVSAPAPSTDSSKDFPALGGRSAAKQKCVPDVAYRAALERVAPPPPPPPAPAEPAYTAAQRRQMVADMFEPRQYGHDGWMTNADWLEWYEHTHPDCIGTF